MHFSVLRDINRTAWNTKLLSTASWPILCIVSVHVTYWRHSTSVWVQIVVRIVAIAHPQLPTFPHLPTPARPPLIDSIRDITRTEKTSSIQIAHGISYKMIAMYVYSYTICTLHLAWLYHTTREVQYIQYMWPGLGKPVLSAHYVFREILIWNIQCAVLLWYNAIMPDVSY